MPNVAMRIGCGLLAFALLASGCVGLAGGDEPLAEMTVEPLGRGRVEVVRDGASREVADATAIRTGDLIVTDFAQAHLRLEGDRNIWVGAFSNVFVATETTVEARAGSVLADAAETTSVLVGDVEASSASGVFRVDRRVATARAATYRGGTLVSAPGVPRVKVAPLFQVSIAAGDVAAPSPYKIGVDDVWDDRWLESVVALDDELERLAASFSNQLTGAPRLGRFRDLAGRPVPFVRPFLRREPADLFIAFTIAERSGAPFAAAFEEAFALRDDGGSWGVVAAIMDVEGEPLVADVEDILLDMLAEKRRRGRVFTASPGSQKSRSEREGGGEEPSPAPPADREPRGDEPNKPNKPDKPGEPPEECEGGIDCVVRELPLPDELPSECEDVDCVVRYVLKPLPVVEIS